MTDINTNEAHTPKLAAWEIELLEHAADWRPVQNTKTDAEITELARQLGLQNAYPFTLATYISLIQTICTTDDAVYANAWENGTTWEAGAANIAPELLDEYLAELGPIGVIVEKLNDNPTDEILAPMLSDFREWIAENHVDELFDAQGLVRDDHRDRMVYEILEYLEDSYAAEDRDLIGAALYDDSEAWFDIFDEPYYRETPEALLKAAMDRVADKLAEAHEDENYDKLRNYLDAIDRDAYTSEQLAALTQADQSPLSVVRSIGSISKYNAQELDAAIYEWAGI